MSNRHILGIFALVLIVTSLMRLFGLSLQPVVEVYRQIASIIMLWFLPELYSEVYPAGVKVLAIFVPLIFLVTIALFIFKKVYYRERKNKSGN